MNVIVDNLKCGKCARHCLFEWFSLSVSNRIMGKRRATCRATIDDLNDPLFTIVVEGAFCVSEAGRQKK